MIRRRANRRGGVFPTHELSLFPAAMLDTNQQSRTIYIETSDTDEQSFYLKSDLCLSVVSRGSFLIPGS